MAEETKNEEVVAQEVETTKTSKTKKEEAKAPAFNWDDFEKESDGYSKEERKKYLDLYDDTLNQINEGEVINGTVISLNKKEVVINIGYKSEGVVSRNEFRYNEDLKIGDPVELLIETMEDKSGQLIVSHKKSKNAFCMG